jgi:hypothetical protein
MPVTAAPQQGHGVAITWESGFFAWITNVSPMSLARAALETTNSSTTTARTFRPEVLYNSGELSVTIQFDSSKTPPITEAAESITITFPMAAGAATAATLTGSGFMTAYNPTVDINGIMTATCTIKWTGAITVTAAA